MHTLHAYDSLSGFLDHTQGHTVGLLDELREVEILISDKCSTGQWYYRASQVSHAEMNSLFLISVLKFIHSQALIIQDGL
jgi:hypothetical protein